MRISCNLFSATDYQILKLFSFATCTQPAALRRTAQRTGELATVRELDADASVGCRIDRNREAPGCAGF